MSKLPPVVMDNGTGYTYINVIYIQIHQHSNHKCVSMVVVGTPKWVTPAIMIHSSLFHLPLPLKRLQLPAVESALLLLRLQVRKRVIIWTFKWRVYESAYKWCISGIEDLDFYIGDEAFAMQQTYSVNYPIRHGQVRYLCLKNYNEPHF